jgi:hypothetical protein
MEVRAPKWAEAMFTAQITGLAWAISLDPAKGKQAVCYPKYLNACPKRVCSSFLRKNDA